MIGQKNITSLIVGGDLPLASAGDKKEDLQTGQIGVFVGGSAVDSALATDDSFQVAVKMPDGSLKVTPHVVYGDISAKDSQPFEVSQDAAVL